MAMDPKQQRVLRDGTASEADQPRRTDREAIRAQAEHPPVEERPRSRPRTAAVADVRVNLPSGTPVERIARESGALRIPELGNSRDKQPMAEALRSAAAEPSKETNGAAPVVEPGEARRVLKARREHSKGDGNFPKVDPGPELVDEREEDRTPRDVPKSRDDRSAPKGNAPTGQMDRNPKLDVRDDHQPKRPRRAPAAPPAAASRAKNAKRTSRAKPTTRGTRKPTKAAKNPQRRAAAARGSKKPLTKRAVRRGGPRRGAGATRGGKR
jgi:hypothetical protein